MRIRITAIGPNTIRPENSVTHTPAGTTAADCHVDICTLLPISAALIVLAGRSQDADLRSCAFKVISVLPLACQRML